MLSRFRLPYAALALATAMGLAGPVVAQTRMPAADGIGSPVATNSTANISCKQADRSMMADSDTMKSQMPASSGNADKDFARMMAWHETTMLSMAKLEMRCGNDPKMKEAAKRFVENAPRTHRFSGDST